MEWAIVFLALVYGTFMVLVVNKTQKTSDAMNRRLETLVERLTEFKAIKTGEMAIVHHRERMEQLKSGLAEKTFKSDNDVPEVETLVYGE